MGPTVAAISGYPSKRNKSRVIVAAGNHEHADPLRPLGYRARHSGGVSVEEISQRKRMMLCMRILVLLCSAAG